MGVIRKWKGFFTTKCEKLMCGLFICTMDVHVPMYVQVGFSIHLKCKIFAKQLSKEIVEMYRGQLNIVLSVEITSVHTEMNTICTYVFIIVFNISMII